MFSGVNQAVAMRSTRANFSFVIPFVRGFPTSFHEYRDNSVTTNSWPEPRIPAFFVQAALHCVAHRPKKTVLKCKCLFGALVPTDSADDNAFHSKQLAKLAQFGGNVADADRAMVGWALGT